jgi:DNA-binding NarL/FixJ family response regulator
VSDAAVRTVFVVEDDAITRESLCKRVALRGKLATPVAVGTVKEIRTALIAGKPDILLVDLELPDGNGIDVIAEATTRYPGLPIMVITVFGDERRVVNALKAGASGYLLKDDESHEVAEAIGQLLDGGSPISPAIARHLIRIFKAAHIDEPSPAVPRGSVDSLTARELEVLRLAAKGFSYAEIAQMLSLTANTIASYTKRIYEKLAVNSRAEAVYEASRLGLIKRE